MNAAVKKLNADLSKLQKAQSAEKKAEAAKTSHASAEKAALAKIHTQEQAIVDQFSGATALDPATAQKLLGQMYSLGQQSVQTTDKYQTILTKDAAAVAKDKKSVAADKKVALKDLKPAEYHLSLAATNKDRKALGLGALTQPVREQSKPGSWKPGPGTLHGADTSHYQSQATFEQSIKGAKFATIKATEGTSYVDPTFKSRWKELGKLVDSGKMKLRMAYAFLTPGNGAAQAKHFLNTLGIHGPLKAGTRLVLDWEGSALNDPKALHDAANYIHAKTGVWPVVYVQGSKLSAANAAAPHAPKWEAAYGSAVNRSVPFFQYSDGPGYDHDVFNGNLKALEKFAGY